MFTGHQYSRIKKIEHTFFRSLCFRFVQVFPFDFFFFFPFCSFSEGGVASLSLPSLSSFSEIVSTVFSSFKSIRHPDPRSGSFKPLSFFALARILFAAVSIIRLYELSDKVVHTLEPMPLLNFQENSGTALSLRFISSEQIRMNLGQVISSLKYVSVTLFVPIGIAKRGETRRRTGMVSLNSYH